jgi:hypothetical protein
MTFIEPKTIQERLLYDPVGTVVGIIVVAIIVLMLTGVIPVKIYTACTGSVC